MKDYDVENLCCLGTWMQEWKVLRRKRRKKNIRTLNKQIKERKEWNKKKKTTKKQTLFDSINWRKRKRHKTDTHTHKSTKTIKHRTPPTMNSSHLIFFIYSLWCLVSSELWALLYHWLRLPYALYDLLYVTFDGLILRDIHTNGLILNLWIFCAFCEGWIDGDIFILHVPFLFI